MNAERYEPPVDPTPLEHEAYGWVVRFISGGAGADEIEALKQWSARSPAHAEAFDQASKVWQTLDPARQNLLAGTMGYSGFAGAGMAPARSRMGRRVFLGGALAASVAGAAVLAARPPLRLWPSLTELSADYRTHTGEQRQINLADSVSVDMNTQTSIAMRPAGDASGRFELISGEAMVSMPGSSGPVTVLAADGRITASRARFNLRCDDQAVRVTCLEGDVQVERLAATLSLGAGQQATYSPLGIGVPTNIDPSVVTAWRDGVVIFDGTPVADVIAEVNRYRPGKIVLTNAVLGRERFNARFRIENIDRVVGQIEQIFGAHATALPGGITLLG
jgi:transmembrane sensor